MAHGLQPAWQIVTRTLRRISVVLIVGAMAHCVHAQVEFTVTFKDLPADQTVLAPVIKSNLIAAAQAWADQVDAKPCTIAILFRVDRAANAGRGSGRSVVTARLGNEKDGDKLVSEQGWASKMRTGKRSRGDEPDIEVVLEPTYMKTIWWDPDPSARKAAIPRGKLDSMSVLLHEFGHALAFNGWRDPKTGELPANFISTYDRNVKFEDGNFFYIGPAGTNLWGERIPLAKTRTNYHHFCEEPTGRNAELKADLMNGVVMEYGHRYEIGRLDLAVLEDCGIPLKGASKGRRNSRATGK
jgi:hypothetical protein